MTSTNTREETILDSELPSAKEEDTMRVPRGTYTCANGWEMGIFNGDADRRAGVKLHSLGSLYTWSVIWSPSRE